MEKEVLITRDSFEAVSPTVRPNEPNPQKRYQFQDETGIFWVMTWEHQDQRDGVRQIPGVITMGPAEWVGLEVKISDDGEGPLIMTYLQPEKARI